MTKSTGVRLYRACLRCRQRKTKCDLQYTGDDYPEPCSKCSSEGSRCILATSNRGGDYSRFRGRRYDPTEIQPTIGSAVPKGKENPDLPQDGSPGLHGNGPGYGGIQNPLEALQILAQTAANAGEAEKVFSSQTLQGLPGIQLISEDQYQPQDHFIPSIMSTEMIREGIISKHNVAPLLQYYAANYHPYFPIVGSSLLSNTSPEHLWATEGFLLASVLTIATQSRPDHQLLHTRLRRHIDQLILRVALAARSVRNVGSVEGLLLLAEWMPHLMGLDGQFQESQSEQSSTYDEDCVAWNLIGLAVRQAYLLQLDKQSFPVEVESEPHGITCRKRLAWIFTYLADRQISIQMGQAFWCRGPGLSTRFSTQDYPSLQPAMTGGIDYAAFMQAQVELTTIFGNIHDILYASKSRTLQLMLMGDYSKYLDDGAKAMGMWKGIWSKVDVPSSLSCLLTLQFEYLKLYVNAFAFQAVIYRAYKKPTTSNQGESDSFFPDSIMGSPDARHIYAAIDAAKMLLQHLVGGTISGHHVTFLPIRYYLYEIYASVFLFKAHAIGAIHSDEYQTCFILTTQFISLLEAAGSTPTHIASRYAELLKRLWCHEKPKLQDSAQRDILPALDRPSNMPSMADGILQTSSADNESATAAVPDVFTDMLHMDLGRITDLGNEDGTFFSSLPFFRGFQDEAYLMDWGPRGSEG